MREWHGNHVSRRGFVETGQQGARQDAVEIDSLGEVAWVDAEDA